MTTSFKTLCNELNLPSTYEQESNIHSLEAWCREYISQDVHYDGNLNEIYDKYLAYVANYLDNFIAHLPDNIAQNISFYGNLNAIHYAAQHGYNRFIEAQPTIYEAVINEGDTYDMTPLHKAATQGHLFTLHALLTKGASVHKANAQMQLPIHRALFVPMLHDKELLLRKGKIVCELLPLSPEALTMQDNDGNTLLHLLATNGFDNMIAQQIVDTNPKLAFEKNNASLSPIHTAILNHQLNMIDLLLSIDGVAKLTDGQKCLPLHYAARYGTAAMVQSCCKATADINSKDRQGRTPLLWAAYAGNQEALKILIDNGADPTITDYQGFSILQVALNEKNEAMARWIVDNLGDLPNQIDTENKNRCF